MENEQDYYVVEAMTAYGGGFVKALAEAARRADPENLARIKAAFPELWQEYGKDISRLRGGR